MALSAAEKASVRETEKIVKKMETTIGTMEENCDTLVTWCDNNRNNKIVLNLVSGTVERSRQLIADTHKKVEKLARIDDVFIRRRRVDWLKVTLDSNAQALQETVKIIGAA